MESEYACSCILLRLQYATHSPLVDNFRMETRKVPFWRRRWMGTVLINQGRPKGIGIQIFKNNFWMDPPWKFIWRVGEGPQSQWGAWWIGPKLSKGSIKLPTLKPVIIGSWIWWADEPSSHLGEHRVSPKILWGLFQPPSSSRLVIERYNLVDWWRTLGPARRLPVRTQGPLEMLGQCLLNVWS